MKHAGGTLRRRERHVCVAERRPHFVIFFEEGEREESFVLGGSWSRAMVYGGGAGRWLPSLAPLTPTLRVRLQFLPQIVVPSPWAMVVHSLIILLGSLI